MKNYMPYDPGTLPCKPPPKPGESIRIIVEDLPPYKDIHFSIRNPRHPLYPRFQLLRAEAIKGLAGRAPYRGAIGLSLKVYAQALDPGKTITDYMDGVMDTLDGSHGVEFTYLPIAYEDDCQVCEASSALKQAEEPKYDLTVTFIHSS